jgi:hypothetical protein
MGARPWVRSALRKNALAAATSLFETQPEVDGITLLVHGTVEIGPSSAHLQVRLIYAPGAANFACIVSPTLFELRNISLHPTHDRRMRKL